ncbi:hypothetical protein HPB51_016351 [Rhipicephalus microplus]|uniref:Uncharacterized protein n=1 Tax=Rhipicephalus microplus TaxID=6941 RepID=A0A9J6EPD2_RHIMP|nr:hypothetical protein HPB51_016351 [Rhipicephalus microplus]
MPDSSAQRTEQPATLRDGHSKISNRPTWADKLETPKGTSIPVTNTPPTPDPRDQELRALHLEVSPFTTLMTRNPAPSSSQLPPQPFTQTQPTAELSNSSATHTSPPHKKKRCSDSHDDYQADLRNLEAKFDAKLVAQEACLEDKFSTLAEQLSNCFEQQMNALFTRLTQTLELETYRHRNASKAQATAKTPQHVGQHGPAVGAKPPSPLKRLATASKLSNHFRVIVRSGGGLDVRLCSQHKVFNALTMAARLPPSATEEDIACSNLLQSIFVVSTVQETNALAYCTVQEIILTEQRHSVATYLTPPGHSRREVIRGVDIDFTDADLQRMLRTLRNPTVLGARRIKNTTTVVILFNGLKIPNYVYCGAIMYRCTLQTSDRHLPQQRPSGSPPGRLPAPHRQDV